MKYIKLNYIYYNNYYNKKMSKAVYIGACTDIKPILLYKNISNWVLVDSMPMSEFGIDRRKGFSRSWFIPELLDTMKKNNFSIINQEKDKYYIFKNDKTNQIVKYHINCAVPEEYNKIKDDIKDWDVLVNIGFDPDKIILNECNKKKDLLFIGSNRCVYNHKNIDLTEEDMNTVVSLLNNLNDNPNNNINNSNIFKNYEMINKKKIIKFNNLYDFLNTN